MQFLETQDKIMMMENLNAIKIPQKYSDEDKTARLNYLKS